LTTGTVVVFRRGSNPALGHVGFAVGETATHVMVLGGNQSDAVTVAPMAKVDLLAQRWPLEGRREADPDGDDTFEVALAHVLEMEGGWSDDPYDPGGPTHRGITLATLASVRGAQVTPDTVADLTAALKALSLTDTRSIYRDRYWRPARCDDLPRGLAVMHFDAAVNHGVTGAARMLQEALGVDVDGEIGPQTLSAARRIDQDRIVRGYAVIRERKYRSLPHFWRFGRGWLARVETTLAEALRAGLSTPATSSHPQPVSKGAPMDTSNSTTTDGKWWLQSLTIWGTIVTALATVLPALGPLVGIDLTGDMIRELGDKVVLAAQAVGGLIGTAMTIYGRVRAAGPLVRRDVQVRL
jgi:lysozyme family protein